MRRLMRDDKLFFLACLSLAFALACVILSFYVLPFLIWDFRYDVPAFVVDILAWFHDEKDFGMGASKFLTWFVIISPGLLSAVLAYFISRDLERKEEGDALTEEPESMNPLPTEPASRGFALQVFALMLLVVVLVLILQNIVGITAPTTPASQ